MAFTQEPTRTPVSIEDISIGLFDGADSTRSSDYSVQVKFDDGSIVVRTGNLTPHMTAAQIANVQAFLDAIRVLAEAEILP